MLARKDRISVPDHYHLDLARKWLVDLYEAWGNPEKAAEWLAKQSRNWALHGTVKEGHYVTESLEHESFDGMNQTLAPEQPDTLNTSLSVATVLLHEGRYEEAGKLAQQAQKTNRHVR